MEVTETAAKAQARTCQRGRASRAHEERDIAMGLQQPAAEVTAGRACANYKNSHEFALR
jgi:hypothetical protein